MFRHILVCLLIGQVISSPLNDFNKDLKSINDEARVSLAATIECPPGQCVDENTEYCYNDVNEGAMCKCKKNYAGLLCDLECKNVDIVWILDVSGSVNAEDFNNMKSFVKSFSDQLEIGLDKTRVSVISFSSQTIIDFDLDDHGTLASLKNAVDHIQYQGANTNTADALDQARTVVLDPGRGDRADVKNIVIVVTDGESNVNPGDTVPNADLLRGHTNLGVDIFVIPVGDKTDLQEIEGIAGSADNVIPSSSFDTINQVKNKLLAGTCAASSIDPCDPDPCQNGGTCQRLGDKYLCVCPNKYTGETCAHPIEDCDPNPCKNGGSCSEKPNGYSCSCVAGYTGKDCDTDINECESSPCKNHGTCVDKVNGFECCCTDYHYGKLCQYYDACEKQPCKHGKCKNKGNSFVCECYRGYTGVRCDKDENECKKSDLCKNGGTCINVQGSYYCQCKKGYTGINCDNNIDDCKPNPCQNGGTCVDKVNGYECRCRKPYIGKRCDNIDKCYFNPCLNGGSCWQYYGYFRCNCKPGFYGTICEYQNKCQTHKPCKTGLCVPSGSEYTCKCPPGYYGKNCDRKNFCYPKNPCKNDGECTSKIITYSCKCKNGYFGSKCEHIDRCYPNPCKNHGRCERLYNDYKCHCRHGYRGKNCEHFFRVCDLNCNHGYCVFYHGHKKCKCKKYFYGKYCKHYYRKRNHHKHRNYDSDSDEE